MKEIIELRKEREKHYLNNDGTVTAYMYNEDIHYLKDGKYQEIDNTFIESNNYIVNKDNDFKIYLAKDKYLVNIKLDDNYMNIKLKNDNTKLIPNYTENEVSYINVLPNTDFIYKMHGKELKEIILLKNIPQDKITFLIETNLQLEINNNRVIAKSNEKVIYQFLPLFMKDSNNNYNYNCNYHLINSFAGYELELTLDEEWLKNVTYPVMIDPTIKVDSNDDVQDTYIINNNALSNHNSEDMLKVGVDSNNTIYRILTKFNLPKIGTSCSIISAYASYVTHKDEENFGYLPLDYIGVYAITCDWNEQTANWEGMHDKYENFCQEYKGFKRTSSSTSENTTNINLETNSVDITNLVKEWYLNKPNYGIMLKMINEEYSGYPINILYSKNNSMYETLGSNPKPFFTLTYKSRNGKYESMSSIDNELSLGTSSVNTLSGNLINSIAINRTTNSKINIDLVASYNTNDVVEDSEALYFAKGWRFNYDQYIIKRTIGSVEYLEYIDSSGHSIFFYKKDNQYISEDGLYANIEITNDSVTVKDDDNSMKFKLFNNKFILIEIKNSLDESITINRLENGTISEIIDSNNKKLEILYENSNILVNSSYMNTILRLENNKLKTIESKFGIIKINYNTNSLIEEIIDFDNQKITYNYYSNSPYKVKKVIKYGINGTECGSEEFEYNFLTTTVKSSQGQKVSYTFDKQDNLVEVLYYDKTGNLKNCSGYNNFYQHMVDVSEDHDRFHLEKIDKFSSSSVTVKPIDNLISNLSFYNKLKNNQYVEKITTPAEESFYLHVTGNIEEEIYKATEDNYYTFSIDIKNQTSNSVSLFLKGGSSSKSTIILKESDFTRYSITDYFEKDSPIKIGFDSVNEIDIINVQLELGPIANKYNLIQNPSFKEGTDGWLVLVDPIIAGMSPDGFNHSIVKIDENNNAYHFCNSVDVSYTLSQLFDIRGKKGDAYNLSFLYKNSGLHEATEDDFNGVGTQTIIRFFPAGSITEEIETYELNKHNEWGIFNNTFIAPYDYNGIVVEVSSIAEINDLYVTNFSLVKDINSMSIKYDENGKINEFSDVIGEKTQISYNEDKQISSIVYSGYKSYECEYDKNDKKKLINLLNGDGIKQTINYNDKGKIIGTSIKNVKNTDDYHQINIRLKGTNKYLTPNYYLRKIELKDAICSIAMFDFIQSGNYYKIKPSDLPDFYLCFYNDTTIIKQTDAPSLFEIRENSDYSVCIKEVTSNKYLYVDGENVILKEYENGNKSFDFYIEFDKYNNKFLTNSYIFDGNSKKYTDSFGSTIKYESDEITNLLKNITDPNGTKTIYEYNSINQLIKIKKEDKMVDFSYNDSNKISKISSGTKEYSFIYDEFLNITDIKLNNQSLISYEYDSISHLLSKINYGNGDTLQYTYDGSNRISKVVTTNQKGDSHETKYFYDNFNNLVKVIADEALYQSNYDLLKKAASFNVDDIFSCVYSYKNNYEISDIVYKYLNQEHNVVFGYTNSGSLIETQIKQGESINEIIKYEYDELGRLIRQKVNDNIIYEQDFYNNGNKSTPLVKSINVGTDSYVYNYNNLGNIVEIRCNNQLLQKFEYDNLERLTKEYDYADNVKIVYEYDLEGNIKNVFRYNIETNALIKTDEYQYANMLWEDQLTKFNNESITYDNIGNAIAIGSNILTWNSGRKLKSYENMALKIIYDYDYNGLRSKKVVGNVNHKYYYQDGDLIVEDIDGDIIKFIYDENSGLIALIYQNKIYYYEKNNQGDVIGILDSNLNKVVQYKYDSWGVIESVIDETSDNIGTKNPFRYRGYYYDEETNLYYINARYYNPNWRRFINADGSINAEGTIDGYNLYAYVGNNPINRFDLNGNFSLKNFIKKTVNAIATAATKIMSAITNTQIKTKAATKKVCTGIKSNTNGLPPKIITKDKSSVNIGQISGIDVSYEESVSVADRDSKLLDYGIEFANDGEIDMVFDVGNTSYTMGDSGLGMSNKLKLSKTSSFFYEINFDGKASLENLFLGHVSISVGGETSVNGATTQNKITLKENALSLALQLCAAEAYSTVGEYSKNINIPKLNSIPIGGGISINFGELRRAFGYLQKNFGV